MTDLIPPTTPTPSTNEEVVTIDPMVAERPTVASTTEASPRRGRWWLPVLVLVLATGAVVGAFVVDRAAQDEQSSAERVEQRADDRLAELDAEAAESTAALAELARPARQFLAIADEAGETADRVTQLDVEEMAMNRSSIQYAIVESFDQYNGVIDKLNVHRTDQYQAAVELYQVLNRLRAIEI